MQMNCVGGVVGNVDTQLTFYLTELKEIEENGKQGIYWQINFPFMMSNRDVSFYFTRLREDIILFYTVKP